MSNHKHIEKAEREAAEKMDALIVAIRGVFYLFHEIYPTQDEMDCMLDDIMEVISPGYHKRKQRNSD